MLAAIGWTHLAGLIGVLIASVGLAVATTGSVALAFLLGIGLQAWWMGYLALLGRAAAFVRLAGGPPDEPQHQESLIAQSPSPPHATEMPLQLPMPSHLAGASSVIPRTTSQTRVAGPST